MCIRKLISNNANHKTSSPFCAESICLFRVICKNRDY
nr:MAG TPA: hypothetical protein [Crassvirales sp.]